MKTCDLKPDGVVWRCDACGRVVRKSGDRVPVAQCREGVAPEPQDVADGEKFNLPAVEPFLHRNPSDSVSWLQKVKNFASASAKHVAAGMPMASDSEIIRRHDICLACEFFKGDACTKCGCPIARKRGFVSKLSWADQECPVGKWGKATS